MTPANFAPAIRQHRDLPLTEIGLYPYLADALQAWQQSEGVRAPRTVDPMLLPQALLPYVMLLDFEENPTSLRVRLAGTELCAKYGGELKGQTPEEFFAMPDARHVMQTAIKVAHLGLPSLALRSYVNMDGKLWSYVRLVAPLSRSGSRIDGMFKAIDPTTLRPLV